MLAKIQSIHKSSDQKSNDKETFMIYFFQSLNISTGNFPEDEERGEWTIANWLLFFITVINMTIMMLNVIIAIVSDTYAEFEKKKLLIDLDQKLDYIIEFDILASLYRKFKMIEDKESDWCYY